MSSPSFTISNYASQICAVTFDVVHKDGTELSRDETVSLQSPDISIRRDIFAHVSQIILEVFSDDHCHFETHFMTANDGKPRYWAYFGHTSVMGGYITFFLRDIKTIPYMIEQLETLSKKITSTSASYALKFVHLNVGSGWSSKSDNMDTYKCSTCK
jgi:hypothetical protein